VKESDLRLFWLLARAIDNLQANVLARQSVSLVQFIALRFIWLHEEPNLGMIARALSISNAAATKLIDRMVKKGWVRKEPCFEDRRERRLALTGQGEAMLRISIDEGLQAVDKVVSHMVATDLAAMAQGTYAFLHSAAEQGTDLEQVCLRCGRQHESTCPGADLFRQ